MALKFYYNGIKDNGGELQLCWYSTAELCNFPKGTITIYARKYKDFSAGISAAFTVENNSDFQTDYVEQDKIRVQPDHPLYPQVLAMAEKARNRKTGLVAA